MFDWATRTALQNRMLTVTFYVVVLVVGILLLQKVHLDVFPEFAPPQVVIQTESPGLAAEDVEQPAIGQAPVAPRVHRPAPARGHGRGVQAPVLLASHPDPALGHRRLDHGAVPAAVGERGSDRDRHPRLRPLGGHGDLPSGPGFPEPGGMDAPAAPEVNRSALLAPMAGRSHREAGGSATRALPCWTGLSPPPMAPWGHGDQGSPAGGPHLRTDLLAPL